MSYVDLKYIHLLSGRLHKFKQSGTNTYVFRCPICGDSKKSQNKTRGNIFEKNGSFLFHCYNCGESKSLGHFIEYIDSSLYTEYRMEHFYKKETKPEVVIPKTKPFKLYDTGDLKELIPISEIDDSIAVKQYIIQRMIPEEHWRHLYYCDEFKSFVNKLLPGKIQDNVDEEPRLVIPFFDENKKMFAFAGRSFKQHTSLRYMNIVLDENKPKLFGLERWKKNETTIIVEGPLDSLFIRNCISSAGGDLISSIRDYSRDNFIICYDNEPSSPTTRKKIRKAIEQGYRVCIWPNYVREKDINKMVQEGKKSLDIERMICDSAASGLKARLALASWR